MEEKNLQALQDFFKKNHITQLAISQKTGIKQPQINRLLKGKDNFGKKTAETLADAYGLSALWLMTGQGEMVQAATSNNVDVLMLPVINLDTRAGLGSYNEVVDTPLYVAEQMPFSRSIARDGDFVMPVAIYKRSKTGNEVHITIPADAQALAAKYMARNGKLSLGYHFHRYEDLRSMLGRTLREIRKKLGIPQLCYYSARKTFVQFGYELGIPLYLLEYAVGQTVKDVQRRPIYNYFRIMQPQVDEAVAKIIAYSR